MLFNLANLAYWIFLGIGTFLFLFVIISGGADDDFDLDADADIDSDFFGFDTDADGEFTPLHLLGWLGFGKAPLILLLGVDFSLWGITGWMLNVMVGSFTGTIPSHFFGLGGIVLVVSLCFSFFIGSLVARPLGKIFASFGEDVSEDRLIGCVGTLTSSKLPYRTEGTVAQADVFDAAHNLVTINITLPEWARVIPSRGQEILIIERNSHSYLAIAKDSSDEDRWLSNLANLPKDSI